MLAHSCLLSLTLTTAQTPNTQTAAPSKDTVLFDFDSGNFDGWTLTGDCWDKQPPTAERSAADGV